MILSKEKLLQEAANTGFRGEILEKVVVLMRLLESFSKDGFLRERLVLKGGTALNLFYFDLPRLSVDIDLNYVGAIEREVMIDERKKVETKIQTICEKLGLKLHRQPTVHAGGKMVWRYPSALGNQGNIEIDLNYMYRVPIYPIQKLDSVTVAGIQIQDIPVLDIHELAAGKLSALVDRGTGRDVFDAYQLFNHTNLDDHKLRKVFVIYTGMSRKKDCRALQPEEITYDPKEFRNRLLPMLSRAYLQKIDHVEAWSENLIQNCQKQISRLLPFVSNEKEFLNQLLDHGCIEPESITDDINLQEKIKMHPALLWASYNVRRNNEARTMRRNDG